jgi:hypothetical protein
VPRAAIVMENAPPPRFDPRIERRENARNLAATESVVEAANGIGHSDRRWAGPRRREGGAARPRSADGP